MTYNTIEFERRGAIGMLTLNRPDKLNAISLELISELRDFFGSMKDDLQTRVIILQGRGRAFCAGLDLSEWNTKFSGEHGMGDVQYAYHKIQQPIADIVVRMRHAPQPIIAAVRGYAVGAGLSISLAADVRIAGESARFNPAYIRIGLSGCDIGSSYFLPRLIGLSRASEFLLTGRFIDAATADRFGLVSRVVPDEQVEAAALEIAGEMVAISPYGLRMTKETLAQSVDAPSLESAVEMENRTQILCALTQDAKEGPRAFLEKRAPVYRDR